MRGTTGGMQTRMTGPGGVASGMCICGLQTRVAGCEGMAWGMAGCMVCNKDSVWPVNKDNWGVV